MLVDLLDHEFFVYREKIIDSISEEPSFLQKINPFNRWHYCCKSLMFENLDIDSERLVGKSLYKLGKEIRENWPEKLPERDVKVVSNSKYRDSFCCEGAHSDLIFSYEKGLSIRELAKISEIMEIPADYLPDWRFKLKNN